MAGSASRGARIVRALVIFVIVAALLLLIADRVGVYIAERVTGGTIQSSQDLQSRPTVDIAGFPFLTQFASNTYDDVTVTADDVPVGTKDVTLDVSQLKVELHHVTTSRTYSTIKARRGTATALITYANLGRTLGVKLSFQGNGRIRAAKSVTVLGKTYRAGITAQPSIVNGVLSFGKTAIQGASQLGQQVSSVLDRVFNLSIPLKGIPFQIRVRTLKVDARGLHVTLAGRNLSFSGSG